MRHRLSLTAVLAASLVAFAPPRGATAQGAPLVLELNGGAAVPLASFASGTGVGEGATAAPAFRVTFTRAGAGRRTLYVGFAQQRFGCAGAGCAAGGRYVATGVDGGFRFTLRRGRGAMPWLGVGALTTRVESPGVPGSPAGVSRLGLGGEAALGVVIGAGRSVGLNPAVRFAGVDTDLPGGARLRMRYLVAELGLVLAF